MARTSARALPERGEVMVPEWQSCPVCGAFMRLRYDNHRTVVGLAGAVRLRLKIRRCEREACAFYRRPYRPEAEGAVALPQHEFGLDIVALVGVLRHHDHYSVPEIHGALRERGVDIAERTVCDLLDRYDELLATSPARDGRLRARLAEQGRVILALNGLQPDVGHEVLARSLLSGAADDLARLLKERTCAMGAALCPGARHDG